jgi:MFS family permease
MKHGSDRVAVPALVAYAGSLVCLGFSTTGWQLALSLVLFGLAGNFCNIAVNTQGVYAEGLFPKPIMGSFHGSWSLAGLAGALTGMGMNAFHVQPSVHFCITAAVVLLIVFFNRKFLVRAKPKKESKPHGFWSGFSGILIWLGVIAFCCRTSEGIMYDWSGVYFREVVMAKGALSTLGYAAFMVTMTGGRFFSDKLVARFGRRKILIASGIIVSMGLYAAVTLPYLLPSTLSFMLVGIGVATVFPIVFSIAGSNPNIPTSAALTVITSISFLGFLTGPPLIGYIAQQSSLRYSFAFVGVFGLLIAAIVFRRRDIR